MRNDSVYGIIGMKHNIVLSGVAMKNASLVVVLSVTAVHSHARTNTHYGNRINF